MLIDSSTYDNTAIICFNFYGILGQTVKSDIGVSILTCISLKVWVIRFNASIEFVLKIQ